MVRRTMNHSLSNGSRLVVVLHTIDIVIQIPDIHLHAAAVVVHKLAAAEDDVDKN